MVKIELIIVEHDGRVRHALWEDTSLITEDSVVDVEGETFRVHRVIESAADEFDAVALLVEPEGRFDVKPSDGKQTDKIKKS